MYSCCIYDNMTDCSHDCPGCVQSREYEEGYLEWLEEQADNWEKDEEER